ncbi:hypothetical protein MKW92_008495 [Papaver armeniacum]|nr:hypothetical protein MKW92_008495 [Papaver armeniacum]
MAISILRRGTLARRSQFQLVRRNVNTLMLSWAGLVLGNTLNLGSRALCSKPDIVAQNETKTLSVSNPTKIVFKYVCVGDEPLENNKCFKIRKIIETPTGDALFQLINGGDKYYSMSTFFLSILGNYVIDAQSFSGQRVSLLVVYFPPLFEKENRGLNSRGTNSGSEHVTIPCDLYNVVSDHIWDIIRSGDKIMLDSDTGRMELILDFHDFLDIRIWLKKNGFDFMEDPLAFQKLEQAVEREISRGSNAIKLNLPVPAGHPKVSTKVSWGTTDDCSVPCSTSGDC